MIGSEHHFDHVACARNVVWQGGATGLPHQLRPVSISYCQVVKFTDCMVLKVKDTSELQDHYQSFLHLDCMSVQNVVWIFIRVVWRGDNACVKEFYG